MKYMEACFTTIYARYEPNSIVSSEKTEKSSEKILKLIAGEPQITIAEIALRVGISSRGVEKHLKTLREAGLLRRVGADKGGYWEIVRSNVAEK